MFVIGAVRLARVGAFAAGVLGTVIVAGAVTGAVVLAITGVMTGTVAVLVTGVVVTGAVALATGAVTGVAGCAGAALAAGLVAAGVFEVVEVLGADGAVGGVDWGLGVDGAAGGVLTETVGVLAGLAVAEALGRLAVAEVAVATGFEMPAADATPAKAQKAARQLTRASRPARRMDERAQGRLIAWRASDALKIVPSRPTFLFLVLC